MPLWATSTSSSLLLNAVGEQVLQRRVAALPDGPLLVVVPTSRQRKDMLVAWAQNHGRGEPPEIMTMSTFVRTLGRQLLPDGPRILPDASVDVLLRFATRAADVPKGAVRLRASRIARWAQEGNSADLVRSLSNRVDGARRRRHLQVLSQVWMAYTDLVGRRACDRGTYAAKVVDEAARRNSIPYKTTSGDIVSRLLVLDTHGLTFTDKMLLHALCRSNWDVGIAFALDHAVENGQLTTRSQTDQMWLVSHGWAGGTVDVECSPTITVKKFPTRTDEVRRALALVKEHLQRGVDLRNIAICVPGIVEYRRLIQELAEQSQIPVDMDGSRMLASSRTASAVRSACDVIANAWQRTDVERMLRDPLIRRSVPDVTDLLRVAMEDRIIGGEGASAWLQRCEQRRNDANVLAESERDDAEEWGRKRRRYDKAMRVIVALRPRLDVHPDRPIDAGRFSEIVLENICNNLGVFAQAWSIEKSAPDAIEETLSSYRAISRDHRLPPVRFSEHLDIWWTMVQCISLPSECAAHTGLAVLQPAELRSRARKLVIAVGCVEGEFPRKQQDALDEDLMPGAHEEVARESMSDICASVGQDGWLLCTYPETLEGSAVLPSALLEGLAHGEVPDGVWQSLDTSVTILLDQRDVRVRAEEAPCIDSSQTGSVAADLDDVAREVFDADILRPLSPSRLDVVTQCPFKYHAQKTLRLDDTGYDDERLTPLERGTILHEVVHRFYRSYQGLSAGIVTDVPSLLAGSVDLRTRDISEHWSILREMLDGVLAEYPHDHVYAEVERRALVGTDVRAGLLYRWLVNEIKAQNDTGFVPVLFEHEIEVEIEIPFADGKRRVLVKTRVDRIDVKVDGDGLEFVVNDYKSSIAAHLTRANVVNGIVTQMPIYLVATQAYFHSLGIQARPAGAVYRAFGNELRSLENVKHAVLLAEPSSSMGKSAKFRDDLKNLSLQDQLERILQNISPAILDLRGGMYPVRPTKDACATCSFAAFCRLEQWGTL